MSDKLVEKLEKLNINEEQTKLDDEITLNLQKAAKCIKEANAFLFSAGAGNYYF
jgi:hypothetical protein